ncbi:4-hydroxy-tetrahydrodipicolinate reductase, partial [Klebsiella pneumoniae]|nr:4-hydroxy-tetrahydrodipicolinate reductase [Klebsiella pneumoniae]
MSKETIKIVIAGPRGRMGSEAVKLVEDTAHFELVGAIDRTYNRKKLSEVLACRSEAAVYT